MGASLRNCVISSVAPRIPFPTAPGGLLAGELLKSEAAVLGYAGNVTYNGKRPRIRRNRKPYPKGARRASAEENGWGSSETARRGGRSGRLKLLLRPRNR